jgi:hypothetical protein
MSKGGRRSTSFRPGVSGNPDGRPKRPETIEARRVVADVKATLAAVRNAGPVGLGDDEIGNKVQTALGFRPEVIARRGEWMLDPRQRGSGRSRPARRWRECWLTVCGPISDADGATQIRTSKSLGSCALNTSRLTIWLWTPPPSRVRPQRCAMRRPTFANAR